MPKVFILTEYQINSKIRIVAQEGIIMIKLHGKNLKGVTLSVHLTDYGLVLIEDGNSETFSFDNIIDIVYHDDKAKTGRLDINLKKQERVIMIVDIKEKKIIG